MSVAAAKEAFTARNPCPICGGHRGLPQHQGIRCHGYLDSTGEYARCSRPEYATGLAQNSDGTYTHFLKGECNCGTEHGAPDLKPLRVTPRPVTAKEEPEEDRGYTVKAGKIVFPKDADPEEAASALIEAGKWHRITSPEGELLGYHERKGRWISPEFKVGGLDGVTRSTLYRLSDVLEQPPDDSRAVFLVEGEKCADALWKWGFLACATFGATADPEDKVLSKLLRHRVFLFPDHDGPNHNPPFQGEKQADRLGERLATLGGRAYRITWKDAPEKGDVADLLADVNTAEEARERLQALQRRPVGKPSIEKRGLRYHGYFPSIDAELDLSRLHDSSGGGLDGELCVRASGKELLQARFNLTSLQTRGTWARELDRMSEGESHWRGVLETFCREVLKIHRAGFPSEELGDEEIEESELMTLFPILWRDGPTEVYAGGGTGKSIIGGVCLLSLATGKEIIPGWVPQVTGNVGLLDWEDNKSFWQLQIKAMCRGAGIDNVPPQIKYRPMSGALADHIEDVAEWAVTNDLKAIVVDAVEPACGSNGDEGYNARAERLFDALREIGRSALLLDHVSSDGLVNGDKKTPKPIGGVRKRDRARAMYELKAEQEPTDTEIEISLRDEKRNRRARQETQSIVVHFSDFHPVTRRGRVIRFTRNAEVQAPSLVSTGLTVTQKILRVLAERGPMKGKDIAASIEPSETLQTVSTYLGRMAKRNQVMKRDDDYWILAHQTDLTEYLPDPQVNTLKGVDRSTVDQGSTPGPPYGGGGRVDPEPRQRDYDPHFPYSQPFRPELVGSRRDDEEEI